MKFSDALDAVRHAAYRASLENRPWGVYSHDGYRTAPLGQICPNSLLEVCRP
jgi:hypothetical protein